MAAWVERLVSDARDIFASALDGVAPARLIEAGLSRHDIERDISKATRTVLLACGKASCGMAGRLLDLIGIEEGLVTTPKGMECFLTSGIKINTSSHPVPGRDSAAAARLALQTAYSLKDDDLAVVLLSGGGSSLWAGVPDGLTLEDKQVTVRGLLRSGAPIEELNTVRKHISSIKGGRLAQAIYPAKCVAFVISDVVGDRLSVIASGPTVSDDTTFDQSLAILEARGGVQAYPPGVVHRLRRGANGLIADTPTSNDAIFENNHAFVIGSNRDAIRAAEVAAGGLGYDVQVSEESVDGDAVEAGRMLAARIRRRVDRPTCYLSGGETTVTVMGDGTGGRNQEVALSAAVELADTTSRAVFLSGGTDGIDGPTDAAGAVVTPFTVAEGSRSGCEALSFLSQNNSYEFFDRVGGHIKTGPTGTNVMDLHIALVLPDLEGD